jgi:transposase
MGEKRRQFTREFKLEAVRMITCGERKVEELARDLGVRVANIRDWQRQAAGRVGLAKDEELVFGGEVPSKDEEIRELRRQLEEVTQERDFLKKAATYFAKGSR